MDNAWKRQFTNAALLTAVACLGLVAKHSFLFGNGNEAPGLSVMASSEVASFSHVLRAKAEDRARRATEPSTPQVLRRKLFSAPNVSSPAEQVGELPWADADSSNSTILLPNIPAFAVPYPQDKGQRYEGLTPDAFDKLTDEQLVMLRPPHPRPWERVFFNHIPKCGGTSIASAIRRWGKRNQRQPKTVCVSAKGGCKQAGEFAKPKGSPQNSVAFAKMRARVGNATSIETHRGHGWLEYIGDTRRWATVSVLREPVSWVRSLYNYVTAGHHPLKNLYRSQSLEGMIEIMDDLGYYPRISKLCYPRKGAEERHMFQTQTLLSCGSQLCNCTDPKVEGGSNITITEALMYAKQHILRETDVLGDLSDMPAFTDAMTELCPGFGPIRHENTKKKRSSSELSEKAVEQVKKMWWADIELYEFARRILAATKKFPHLRQKAPRVVAADHDPQPLLEHSASEQEPLHSQIWHLKLENALLATRHEAALHEIEGLKALLTSLAPAPPTR